jgi:APA family basic amino acid/polyamine antiporter
MVAGVWAVAVPTFLFCTRNMLAYSFDRVLPTSMGEVNDRTHTPILATVVVMIGMLLFLAGWVYSSSSFTVYISVSNIVVFLPFAIVGLAAVIFPYRRKAMYQDSPITKTTIAGIPLFSIVGAIDAVLMVVYLILLLANGSTTGATNTTALTVLGLVVAALAAIWILAWVLARQRGLDLAVVQDQLPPE